MVRTQIQLTEDQAEKLEAMAASHQLSKAELVRIALDRLFEEEGTLSRQEQIRRSFSVLGAYHSEYTDIAENHDTHLAEIYGQW